MPKHEKAYDKVKRYVLFNIHTTKISTYDLLETIIVYNIMYNTNEHQNTYHGVRQACPVSPKILNMYTNEMFIHWNQIYRNEIYINDDTKLDIMLFAGDRLLLSE
jgi:hypothetical protein